MDTKPSEYVARNLADERKPNNTEPSYWKQENKNSYEPLAEKVFQNI
jgi:hypothetical protein